jgi:hypothetical protein
MKAVSTETSAMNDETRKLLKIFGVAVTDSEAEAERIRIAAARPSTTMPPRSWPHFRPNTPAARHETD